MERREFIESPKNIEKLKMIATLSDTLDNYVYLREDADGRYIEYAFMEGAPINNRCLSWYDKPHPIALKRQGRDISINPMKLNKVGVLYELSKFTCSGKCSVGKPSDDCCSKGFASFWTIDEPVKCACWHLQKVSNVVSASFSFDD